MKHGDKAKSKTAIKASGKKTSKAGASKSAKIAHPKKQAVKQAVAKSTQKAGIHKKPAAPGGNGKGSPNPGVAEFTNPVIATAFKRAVKKYSNAFRRLPD